MKSVPSLKSSRRVACIFFMLLLASSPLTRLVSLAQSLPSQPESRPEAAEKAEPLFRLERLTIAGGAELLTVFGQSGGPGREPNQSADVPLVSIVRDTLGDDNADNDRLRYVWMLTYT